MYGLLFFVIAGTQPPPDPSLRPSEVAQWFDDHHDGLLYGYAIAALEVAVNPPADESLTVVNALLGDDAGLVGSALLALA